MVKSNLIRGLLFSSLVSTLSTTYALKVSAQVANHLSSETTTPVQTITRDRDLLQKIEILQIKAANLRQALDSLNLQLQEQFDSPETSKVIDENKVLTDWAQFKRIWDDFTRELAKNPEFAGLLQKNQVFQDIAQNLVFQEKIISNLAQVLHKPSSLAIANFQEQLFTVQDRNRNDYPSGTFEEKTQHKFALISTNKARELELQVAQIENVLANHLLQRRLANNGILNTTPISSIKNPSLIDDSEKQINFLNFNFLIVLILLSSCAGFIFLKTYKKNSAVIEDLDPSLSNNSDDSSHKVNNYNVEDYLKNLQQVESQARELLYSTNKIIDKQQNNIVRENLSERINEPFISESGKNRVNLNFTRSLITKTSKKIVQESLSTATSLMTEEDIIALYRENRRLLAEKSIRVEITKESRQRIQTGVKSEIIFKETSNGNYWIVSEPKLGNNCYFLVPSPMIDTTDFIPQSIDNIFTCTRYKNRTSNNFDLKFSAMVQVNSSRSWKLIGIGEIIFS